MSRRLLPPEEASRVEAVQKVTDKYMETRRPGENFHDWLTRMEAESQDQKAKNVGERTPEREVSNNIRTRIQNLFKSILGRIRSRS